MKILSEIVELGSAEWLLKRHPNGGSVIFLRSLWTSFLIYFLVLSLRNMLDPSRTWIFSQRELSTQLAETLPWLGPIFGAIYAALYARFASQWSYLANVYNQIKAAECRNDCNRECLAEWKAAFIEDAQELHLAKKPLFASIIRAWGKNPAIGSWFDQDVPGGQVRLDDLMAQVELVWNRSAAREKW